jgi:hypothetical protein
LPGKGLFHILHRWKAKGLRVNLKIPWGLDKVKAKTQVVHTGEERRGI